MSHMLTQLVRRLATPAVANRLTKEELCLALAALAQLKPWHSPSSGGGGAMGRAPLSAAVTAPSTESLARRGLRVLPQCTAQELRMIARGAAVLQWGTAASPSSSSSAAVVDGLLQSLHARLRARTEGGAGHGGRVRLADAMAVATLALDAGHFFSSTLDELLSEHAVMLARDGAALSSAAAEELVAVLCGCLGERRGVEAAQRVAAALSPDAAAAGKALLQKCVAGQPLPLAPAWAAVYAGWSEHRKKLINTAVSSADVGDEETAVLRRLSAPYGVYQTVQRLRGSGDAAVSDSDMVAALDTVMALQLYDPVTLETLDASLAKRLTASGSHTPLPPATVSAYENVVYTQAQRFPQALTALRRRDAALDGNTAASPSHSDALQAVSPLLAVYRRAVAGESVSAKEIFQIGNDVKTYNADQVAQALFVLVHSDTPFSNLIGVLVNTAAALTADGVVALLRAAARDRAGALRTVLQTCLADAAHLHRCVKAAPAETLAALIAVLAQPPTRWRRSVAEVEEAKAQLAEVALAEMHMRVPTLPMPSLLSIVAATGKLPAAKDVLRAACDRLASQLEAALAESPLEHRRTTDTCLEFLAALEAGDVVAERVLDLLAAALRSSLRPDAASFGDDVLRFSALQLRYAAPEMAEVLAEVTSSVRNTASWAGVATEVLLAAALSTFDSATASLPSSLLGTLPHRVLHHLTESDRLSGRVSEAVATALLELLFRLPSADAAAVRHCIARLLPVAHTLAPLPAAQLVCVAARGALPPLSVLPPEVFATVASAVKALPADVVSLLCRAGAAGAVDSSVVEQLVVSLPALADQLSPHQLASCVYGLGELPDAGQRHSHQVMSLALSDYVVDNAEAFTSARDIASLLHGFAKLQWTDRNLYSVFAARLHKRRIRATLDFRSISFLLFAFGHVRFLDKDLVDGLCALVVDHAEELAAPDLLLTLRGVSRMALLNNTVYWRLGDHALRRLHEFPLEAQCELLHAYAAVEQRQPQLMAGLAESIASSAASLPSASAAADVLVSLWMAEYKIANSAAASGIAATLVARAGELTGSDVTKLCTLLVDTNWAHQPLLQALAARAVELKGEERLEATAARAVLDALGAHFVNHQLARTQLSQLARTVSKDVVYLSGQEEEELMVLIGR